MENSVSKAWVRISTLPPLQKLNGVTRSNQSMRPAMKYAGRARKVRRIPPEISMRAVAGNPSPKMRKGRELVI
jgi:hypothetical protein